jgi:hypothetical protein
MNTEITQDQVDLNEALLELDALKLAHQKLTAERDQLAGRLVQQEQAGWITCKVFVCTNCEGMYRDNPVTECDCLPFQNEFVEGTASYPKVDAPKGEKP